MNEFTHPPTTVKDEWLVAQAAASLTPAKQLILDCQSQLRPDLRPTFEVSDQVAGALLESAPNEGLSAGFMSKLNMRLSEPEAPEDPASAPAPIPIDKPSWMPAPLAAFMAQRDLKLKWRSFGPGVERARVMLAETGERIYLLRARAGYKVPHHGHQGEEWTLVLTGGYHVGDQGYGVGDLHQEDDSCHHSLKIDDDGPCISMVVDEGRLRFSSFWLKLLQPLYRL